MCIRDSRRNSERERKLDPEEISTMWDNVQKNIGKYQRTFKNRLIIVDNSDGKDYTKERTRAYKIMKKFAEEEPRNPIAKKWIEHEKSK